MAEYGLDCRDATCILGHMDGSSTDEEVVVRCLAGETDAFGIIVRRYQARFLRLAAGALGDRQLAQDVVQDTFLTAYTKLHKWEPRAKFSGWLYTVFANSLRDRLRSRKRYGGLLQRLTDHYQQEPPIAEPQALDEGPPDTAWIRPALRTLSKMQRVCILLRDIENLEMPAIAKQLGIQVATVRVHLMRGRRKLREIYEREHKGH